MFTGWSISHLHNSIVKRHLSTFVQQLICLSYLSEKSYSTDKVLYSIVYSIVALVWQKSRKNYKVRSCLFFQNFSVVFFFSLHSEAYNTIPLTCPVILFTSLLWTTSLLFCLLTLGLNRKWKKVEWRVSTYIWIPKCKTGYKCWEKLKTWWWVGLIFRQFDEWADSYSLATPAKNGYVLSV